MAAAASRKKVQPDVVDRVGGERVPFRDVARQFLLIFVPTATLLTLVTLAGLHLDIQTRMTRVETRQTALVDLAVQLAARDFERTASDLRMLANSPDMVRFLDTGAVSDRRTVEQHFLVVAREIRLYDQIRFIDARGMEAIRINYNEGLPSIVPAAELQDKSGRYFFRDTFKLRQGQVFVSPLDLNVEHDRIETPYKPMIRFGMPLFDRHGNKKGVLLLNYFGDDLLRHFRAVMEGGGQIGMLLNRDGYWLSSPNRSDEWGFMFGNGRTFGMRFPEEWRSISIRDHGGLSTANGLFTFATVYPLAESQHSATGSPQPRGPSTRELGQQEYYWKIVTQVPRAALPADDGLGARRGPRMTFLGVLLFLAAGSGYVAYARAGRKQWQAALVRSETRLREIAFTMGEGMFVLDDLGRITFANPEAQNLLGFREEELLGGSAHGLFHHRQADGTLSCPPEQCEILKVIRSGEPYRAMEDVFWRKDGTALPVALSSVPLIRDGNIAGAVVSFHDITERRRAELALKQTLTELARAKQETESTNQRLMAANAELQRLSQLDGLTGVANRRFFDEYLANEWRAAQRDGRPLALVMIDVDHFKAYNDFYGHQAGDDCLKKVAHALLAALGRPRDLLARYGGEEFVAVLAETDLEGGVHIAEKLRSAVELLAILHEKSTSGSCVTASLGVAELHPASAGATAESAVAEADRALYQAKGLGRNRVCAAGLAPCHGNEAGGTPSAV